MKPSKWATLVVATKALIFAVALLVAILLVRRAFTPAVSGDLARPTPSQAVGTRTEVVFVYIGDADCGACQNEQFKRALESVLTGVRQEVVSRGDMFRAIGVIMTSDKQSGYKYLMNLGDWDEISMGGGWLNAAVIENIWNNEGQGIIPQAIVFSRKVHWGPGVFLASERGRSSRLIGAQAFRTTAESGSYGSLLVQDSH
jgi:hypothetical protein